MSSDGCKPVEWIGQPFPYMLHRPDNRSHNYGEKRGAQASGVAARPRILEPCASGTRARAPLPSGRLQMEYQHASGL